jgi:hypothetical protein
MYMYIELALIFQTTRGEYSVDVNLVRYSRQPERCCDTVIIVCNECDVYMKVCLYPSGISRYELHTQFFSTITAAVTCTTYVHDMEVKHTYHESKLVVK